MESLSRSLVPDRAVPLSTPEDREIAGAVVPRTIVVSDVRLYREGLALALHAKGNVHVAGTATDFDGVSELIRGAIPTVVLLDTGMPHALDFARQLLQAEPSVRVVGVAVHENGADIVACAEAGLTGFVPRDGSIDDTINAIIDAMHNELHCSPRIAAALFRHLSHPTAPPESTAFETALLTPRELEVVQLIERGLSNKQIGQRLNISTATVKNHVHHLLEKLKVGKRADAATQLRQQRPAKVVTGARRGTPPNALPMR